MEIPYVVDARPDTGLNTGKLGTWLFLASEVMLFGALFATYIMLRVGGSEWPEGAKVLDVKKATINTAVLIASSVTMVMAWASLMKRNLFQFRLFMGGTVALGGVFMVIKYLEYTAKFDHHMYPSTSTFLAIYFTMTGLHALHVLGGMVLNSYFLGRIPCIALTGLSLGGLYWLMLPGLRSVEQSSVGLLTWAIAKGLIFLFPVLILVVAYMIWRGNTTAELWRTDPQLVTNRVEHAGLFWHFVDLVWIFLFPIFYLT